MRMLMKWGLVVLAATAGCGDVSTHTVLDAGVLPSPDADFYAGTTELEIPVPETGRVYVHLATPSVVSPSGDPQSSSEWDLAFEGYAIHTNSGPSGNGQGGAFGPLEPATFLDDGEPEVPFISPDKAGGAFVDWYDYDETTHVLYSRFHVYGVKRDDRLWKVQIITYYGELLNAPTSALYQVRYAEITSGSGATQTLQVDGTAGGLSAPAGAPSGCLSLDSGAVSQLPVTQAQASTHWDLCFRRDAISVNGERGGPGSVSAVDLEADQTEGEQLAQSKAKTADSEQALFDGVNAASFARATFRGDHVVSAFETGGWLDDPQSPTAPTGQAWLVVDASGQRKFLVAFSAFQNATASSPGTVVAHIKPVTR